MLLQSSLLLDIESRSTVYILSRFPKSVCKMHYLQIQCFQCVVDCQYFSKLLCSFISHVIVLCRIFNLGKINLLKKSRLQNQCGQCAVGFQCLCNLFCTLVSNSFALINVLLNLILVKKFVQNNFYR